MRTVTVASYHRADPSTIVVAVDGSTGSDEAVDWAIAEATDTGRGIQLVHVMPLSDSVVLAPLMPVGFPDPRRYGSDVLRRASLRCRQAGLSVRASLVDGSPADALVDISHRAAMLVVGARGHGDAASLLLGSVSQACAQRAKCPVVVVKRAAARSPGAGDVAPDRTADTA